MSCFFPTPPSLHLDPADLEAIKIAGEEHKDTKSREIFIAWCLCPVYGGYTVAQDLSWSNHS